MKEKKETNAQPLKELEHLQRRIAKFEQAHSERKWAKTALMRITHSRTICVTKSLCLLALLAAVLLTGGCGPRQKPVINAG